MKIYKMLYTEQVNGLLGMFGDNDTVSWALEPKEGAKVVSCKEECKCYDTQYAIEYDIDEDITLEALLELMCKELSVKEVKQICEADKMVEQIFLAHISGKEERDKIASKLESAENAANNASAFAALSMLK